MAVLLKAVGLPIVAALFVSATSIPPEFMRDVQYPLIKRVLCDEGRGTAFRVGQNHWASVAHVTSMTNCEVEGQAIAITDQDGPHDFARFDTETGTPNGLKVNCDGFIPGRWYWAVGHAHGAPFQIEIALYATYRVSRDGKHELIGPYTVIPGMSGGPVLDEDGAVVGTVNSYVENTSTSFSRELKDTSICRA